MANEQNLIPGGHKLTKEEASKGGKKSAQVRREKKIIKDEILKRMKEKDWEEYIDGIIARAKEDKADAEFLRDTIGQKPTDKVEANVTSEVIKVELVDD